MRNTVRMFFYDNHFICSVRDIYDTICEYISDKWIGQSNESLRSFATNHDIDEKTVRQIEQWKKKRYKITIGTLEKICKARDLTIEKFFKLINR